MEPPHQPKGIRLGGWASSYAYNRLGHDTRVADLAGTRLIDLCICGKVTAETFDAYFDARRLTYALSPLGSGVAGRTTGFTLAGMGTRNLLTRAAGPSLAALGVGEILADPKQEIFDSRNVVIGSNDTYAPGLASVFASVGAFAFVPGAKDAALTVSLPPGGYTVQVSGADGGTGTAIVEVYELL